MTYTRPLKALAASLTLCAAITLTACDDPSNIGGSLMEPNVAINVDSNFNILAQSFHQEEFDSRSETMLLGAVDMEGVGSYNSSVVTQLMAASSLIMPDSIPLDSVTGMALNLKFRKGALTGDSLAPCQLKVFQLNRQLPSDIQSSFDPTGYYDPSSPLGVKNYTASVLGLRDSAAWVDKLAILKVNMPLELGKKFITQYRTDASVFQWPQTFNQYFPGLYIENTFGKGCMINLTVAEVAVYWHRLAKVAQAINDTIVYVPRSTVDSATIFSTAPEVLSSNNLHMTIAEPIQQLVAQGKVVVMSPCGYLASIRIPAQEIIDRYYGTNFDLAVVNNLTLSIPAHTIPNNYGLRPAPNLLLVRRCDMLSFFAQNRIPDENKKSFYGTYNTATGKYNFSSMRQYIVDLLEQGGEVKEEDMDFVLIPVNITAETNSFNNVTYVTGCTPYIYQPTLCELDIKNTVLRFTFGSKN